MTKCPECGSDNPEDTNFCGACGKPTDTGPAPYFSVSVLKFVVMSLGTLGLYRLYWFYQNWKHIKKRDGSDIEPFWRTVFLPWYSYPLFKEIFDSAEMAAFQASSAAAFFTTCVFALSPVWLLPRPYKYLVFLWELVLLPVQAAANKANRRLSPKYVLNSKIRGWNFLAVGVAVLVSGLAGIGLWGVWARSVTPASAWTTYHYDQYHFSVDSPFPLVPTIFPLPAAVESMVLQKLALRTGLLGDSYFTVNLACLEINKDIATTPEKVALGNFHGLTTIYRNVTHDSKMLTCSGMAAFEITGTGNLLFKQRRFLILAATQGPWMYTMSLQYPDNDAGAEAVAQRIAGSLDVKLPAEFFGGSRSPRAAVESLDILEVKLKTMGKTLGSTPKGWPSKFSEKEKLARQGDAEAEWFVGSSYLSGKAGVRDYAKAEEWFLKSALQGNAAGQNGLGWCYENGFGVAKNLDSAAGWFLKSAEQGNFKGEDHLGVCYEMGWGVKKDIPAALKWYKASAGQGDFEAEMNLVRCRAAHK